MLRSMYSGISGLRNFQTKLDVIGNNIANVNTAGFKKGRVTFKEAMSQTVAGASASTANRGGKNSMQVALGSTIATIDTVHTGSSLQTTNRPQDLAIEGDGFFVVKQGNAEFYSRAGNFYLDDNGTLVNGDGMKVQAYQLDATGNPTTTYGDVTINVNAQLPATMTNKITFSGNLASGTIQNDIIAQQVKVADSKGNEHAINVHYKKVTTPATIPDKWIVFFGATLDQVKADTDNDTTGATTTNPDNTKPGYTKSLITIPTTGTPTSGGLQNTNGTPAATGIPLPDGTFLNGVTLDVNNLTRTGAGSTAMATPNGYTSGKLESFSIGQMGEVNGVYSNGQIATLGRLALAKFSNTSGLTKVGNNLFQESINSGLANIGAAGDGRGTIVSGSLEMSNVDLSEEFTEMITAQRGFQANTKIITTSDEILQELVNLKR